jgi:hypothetical protein
VVKEYHYLRVEDPAGGVAVSLVGLVGSLVPCVLDLGKKAVLVLFGALLDLLASGGQVARELAGSPAVVGLGHIVVPVLLNKVGKILAVGRGGVWDIVVRKPALKLSLVPLVVSCAASPSVRTCLTCDGTFVDTAQPGRRCCREQAHALIGHAMNEDLPALPVSQSAVAVWVAKATVAKVARENLMMKKCSARGIGQCLC